MGKGPRFRKGHGGKDVAHNAAMRALLKARLVQCNLNKLTQSDIYWIGVGIIKKLAGKISDDLRVSALAAYRAKSEEFRSKSTSSELEDILNQDIIQFARKDKT